jgi:hypothetical protein
MGQKVMPGNNLQIQIEISLILILFSSCILHKRNQKGVIKFFCSEIIIDTTTHDTYILFRINASNSSDKNYFFFANSSTIDRDSVRSNFYILDTLHHLKIQLLVGPGPVLNELYSGHAFDIPVSLVRGVNDSSFRNKISNEIPQKEISDSLLTVKFLQRSRLLLVNNKGDFFDHHLNLKYLIKDTIHIPYIDSTPVYFAVPHMEDFIHDSLFNKEHSPSMFLSHSL